MKRLVTILLLICVGILIPAAASPARVCFLEWGLESVQGESKCCQGCSQGTELPDPCCLDLEKLPDAPAPQFPTELPAIGIVNLPAPICFSPVMIEVGSECFSVSEPIRGPTSPAAYRAILGIWRI